MLRSKLNDHFTQVRTRFFQQILELSKITFSTRVVQPWLELGHFKYQNSEKQNDAVNEYTHFAHKIVL